MCPKQYMKATETAVGKKNRVVPMKWEDFLHVWELLKHITTHQVPGFTKTSQLVTNVAYWECYYIKTSYDYADIKESMTCVKLMKGKGRYSKKAFNLIHPKYLSNHPLRRRG